MNRTTLILAALLLVGFAPRAQVQRFRNFAVGVTNSYNMLNAVALNGAAGTRTLTLDTGSIGDGYGRLLVVLDYTYGAATAVTVTPSCSSDGGTTYGQETSTSIASGTGTVSAYSDSYTTGAANKTLRLKYDVTGCDHYKLIFAGTGANGSDLVNVQAALIVGD